jgi:hypothetical protein
MLSAYQGKNSFSRNNEEENGTVMKCVVIPPFVPSGPFYAQWAQEIPKEKPSRPPVRPELRGKGNLKFPTCLMKQRPLAEVRKL